jgi:hypothetical protein
MSRALQENIVKKFTSLLLVLVLTVAAGLLDGCKAKEKKAHNKTIKGAIDKIDLSSNTVTLSWFNENAGRTLYLAAPVSRETEIYIDGKLADLPQVKVGDQAIVQGYKKGSDLVPVRVDIVRSSDSARRILKPAATLPAK